LTKHAEEDGRIKVIFRSENGHISKATNSALSLATGEFVALLDNDDLLTEHALYWLAEAIIETPDAGLVYSDEDKLSEDGERFGPYFKCEYNPELMLAHNMICHLGAYRKDIIDRIGGFRTGFEGAQDYDLALRVLDHLRSDQVVHIPKILYHWRAIPGSTALTGASKDYAAEAGRRAVAEHLQRVGINAEVIPAPAAPGMNRVRYKLPDSPPTVSIIIPTRDRIDLLSVCIESIRMRSTYPTIEIIVVDNGSTEVQTAEYLAVIKSEGVKVIHSDEPFNFSRLNNVGAKEATGDILCLMNNDIEITVPDWLDEMVSYACRSEIGCVGARLLYPDGSLQHGGVILGIGGVAGHSHKYASTNETGYFGRAVLHQSFSAVTAACLLVRKEVYDEVNGLDESFSVAFNDVDFCLRVRDAGYRNVWTPYAEMIHHESVSRGREDNPEKIARFNGEATRMTERWGDALLKDPAYNPNLTLDHEDFSLAWPPRTERLAS
jgi:GT2 family glycosyltransferase